MYLNFSGLKKKSYCFCLFFIGYYFIFSLINTLIHVKIDQGIHEWKNQLLTHAISKKKIQYLGFQTNYSSIIFYFMGAPDKLPNGVKSLTRFSPNQTSIFMRGSISITSLVSSEATRTIAESVKR